MEREHTNPIEVDFATYLPQPGSKATGKVLNGTFFAGYLCQRTGRSVSININPSAPRFGMNLDSGHVRASRVWINLHRQESLSLEFSIAMSRNLYRCDDDIDPKASGTDIATNVPLNVVCPTRSSPRCQRIGGITVDGFHWILLGFDFGFGRGFRRGRPWIRPESVVFTLIPTDSNLLGV